MPRTRFNPQASQLSQCDPIWAHIREEAEEIVAREPAMTSFILANVLNHDSLEEVVSHRISDRLDHPSLNADLIRRAFGDAYDAEPAMGDALRVDIAAVYDRDPAVFRFIDPVLYFKGFHAIQAHRLAHWLWENGRKDFALYVQSRVSEVFQVDINPAVPMGKGIFIDHATGVVVGATAVIEDDVSILQNVTLGGTGKEDGDRHPKIRSGVLLGAGAKVLGNIEIGCCSRVAAGSVVLAPVPPNTTVAGVPAKVVGKAGCAEPSRTMDQILSDRADG